MKILPLGTGNGFTKKFFHSNLLLEIDNQYILIDAGTTLRYSLEKANIEISQIKTIFITHFHHDHVGGLAEFLTSCFWQFKNGLHRPHRPFLLLRSSQLKDINSLLAPVLNSQGLTWKDYCQIRVIKNNHFQWNKIELQVLPTDNLHCLDFMSCGLKVTYNNKLNILITGDIKDLVSSDFLSHINQNTQAIIQDTSLTDNAVHSSYKEVLSYYPSDFYPIIYGIHYDDQYVQCGNYKINFLEERKPLLLS